MVGLSLLLAPAFGYSKLLADVGLVLLVVAAALTLRAYAVRKPHVESWRIGASGEERVGSILQALESEGYVVLHDRRRPGGRDNIDHIAIGPPGVAIVETKHYRGRVTVRHQDLYLNDRRRTEFIEQVRRQVNSTKAALEVDHVIGIICVVGGSFPIFGARSVGPVLITTDKTLTDRIRSLPSELSLDDVTRLAERASSTLQPADWRGAERD